MAEISLTFRGGLPYTPLTMAAKKTPSTVKTLQAKPKVAAKTTRTKSTKGTKKKVAAKGIITVKPPVVETVPGKKTSLDVLRLFIETYENL